MGQTSRCAEVSEQNYIQGPMPITPHETRGSERPEQCVPMRASAGRCLFRHSSVFLPTTTSSLSSVLSISYLSSFALAEFSRTEFLISSLWLSLALGVPEAKSQEADSRKGLGTGNYSNVTNF